MCELEGYEQLVQLRLAERKLADAAGMYARAWDAATDQDRDLSQARMIEMVRGNPALRRAFGIKEA